MLKRNSGQDFQGVTETKRAGRSRVGYSDLGSGQSRRCYWRVERKDRLSVDLNARLVLDEKLDFLRCPCQISVIPSDAIELNRLTIVFSSAPLYSTPSCGGPWKAHPGHASSTVNA